jgi:hypothetical protein
VIKDYEATEKALLSDSKYHTQFIPRSVANNATIEVSNLQQQGIVDAKAYNAYLDSQSASAGQFVNASVTKVTGKRRRTHFVCGRFVPVNLSLKKHRIKSGVFSLGELK